MMNKNRTLLFVLGGVAAGAIALSARTPAPFRTSPPAGGGTPPSGFRQPVLQTNPVPPYYEDYGPLNYALIPRYILS